MMGAPVGNETRSVSEFLFAELADDWLLSLGGKNDLGRLFHWAADSKRRAYRVNSFV